MSYLAELVVSAKAATSQVSDAAALDNVYAEYLGKEEHLTLQMTILREMPPEECPAADAVINEAKEQVQRTLNVRKMELESAILNARLATETIDVSLPGRRVGSGGLHLVTRNIGRIENFFGELGFTVAIGPEIEDDYHNFDVLSVSGHHPVHADHDTFWFNAARLLRTQTSDTQTRTMRTQQPLIHIITPGRVYRNDYDQTHTLMLHRVEGLIVDTSIGFTNLKGTLHSFLHNFFEEDLQIRFRPSCFPFTESSVEVDVMGKNGKWLEVLGCGMVHPNALRNVGTDPEAYSGFAFEMGMGCLTTLRYSVTDLCSSFGNGPCSLRQFK